jgi:predicted AAA+ superfamily ATPase
MDLSIQNSWWNLGGLWQDLDLKKAKNTKIDYNPKPILAKELSGDALFTLRGPRRSGKTVSLKLLIAELIDDHDVDPSSIVWMTLDTTRNANIMENQICELTAKYSPKYLFLDEVTSVPHWQKVIKKLRDTGTLANCNIVLTGSSAFDLKQGSERMAGRKGGAIQSDRVLLPMSYSEFRKSTSGSVEEYLQVGGFPFRVAQFQDDLKNHQKFDVLFGSEVFDDVFFYEVTRRKLDRNIALEVIFRLSQIKSSAISFEAFSKPLNMTKDTAKKYIGILGDAFLLSTFFSYDTGKNRVALKKDKKLHWVDPSLAYLGYSTKQAEVPEASTIVESVVGTELLRRHEYRLFEGVSSPRNVFTWKSSAGNEIDFLVIDRSQKLIMPIEVKYQNQIQTSDFMSMEKAFHKGILVTKSYGQTRPLSKAVSLEDFLLLNENQSS